MIHQPNGQAWQDRLEVSVVIDQVILEGFDQVPGKRIRSAITDELQRLLRLHGLPASIGGLNHQRVLVAGEFAFSPHLRPAELGRRIARTLFRGMGAMP